MQVSHTARHKYVLFTPDKHRLSTKEQIADLADYLCTLGEPMRSYVPRHPAILRDLTQVFNSGTGRKFKKSVTEVTRSPVMAKVARMRSLRYKQQSHLSWRRHQNMACERRGYCEILIVRARDRRFGRLARQIYNAWSATRCLVRDAWSRCVLMQRH